MQTLIDKLKEPFKDIRQREGIRGKKFDYIPIGDVIERVLTATDGGYEWEVVLLYKEADYWVCQGRLTVNGKKYDGIGTHQAQDLEAPKAAESDAYKRAAVKVGVALHLYTDPHDHTAQEAPKQAFSGGVRLNAGNAPCACGAPPGKPHATKCTVSA